jgi:hypothetical protein
MEGFVDILSSVYGMSLAMVMLFIIGPVVVVVIITTILTASSSPHVASLSHTQPNIESIYAHFHITPGQYIPDPTEALPSSYRSVDLEPPAESLLPCK